VRWWHRFRRGRLRSRRQPCAVVHASERLAVILGAYTVYLDLGSATSRERAGQWPPDRFGVVGQKCRHPNGFAMRARFVSGRRLCRRRRRMQPLLGNAQVATIAPASAPAARRMPRRPVSWRSISTGRRRPRHRSGRARRRRDKARVLLVDSNFRVIAASTARACSPNGCSFRRTVSAAASTRTRRRVGRLHATPGYETYKGLGW